MSWDSHATAETSWQAARWASEESQRERMNMAIEMADLDWGDVLLDWGCGTGRLLEFTTTDVLYIGADASSAMIDRARIDHPPRAATRPWHKDARFEHVTTPSQLDVRPDVTIALGVWNLVEDSFSMPHDLLVLWGKTRRALVASFHVSTGADRVHAEHSPHGILQLALMCEAPLWTVERWKPNDIMLTMRRDGF